MEIPPPQFINGPNGRLAYRRREGQGPNLMWLGGFRSDMLGTKACFLDEWAARNGRSFTRFDYSGHGESDGVFEEGSIGEWAADAIAIWDALARGPQILIGSSMGAWITSLLAKARPANIAGVILIAPAPDFTEELMWPAFTDAERKALMTDGRLERPSEYDEPEVITRKLIEDGRNQLVLTEPVPITCTVKILQGMRDEAVPYAHALKFAERLQSDDVELIVTKNGDHRLSTPADLERLASVLEGMPR